MTVLSVVIDKSPPKLVLDHATTVLVYDSAMLCNRQITTKLVL